MPATTGTVLLDRLGIKYAPYPYGYDPNGEKIGLQAALKLGKNPQIVFKTLMTLVDSKPICVVLPSDKEVSMKKLAAAVKGKSAIMMKPDIAEKQTGYKIGGISPFGQKKTAPTIIDESAILYDEILINGGARGFLIGLNPDDALKACNAVFSDITA